MKSTLIALFLLVAGSTMSFAQCDKKVSLTASKTEHLDATGALKDAKEEKTTVEFSKSDITVLIVNDNGNEKMTGTVKVISCDWKVPFKEGKTSMMVSLHHDNEDARDYKLTIEGKDGKVTLTGENKDQPDDKIKLTADKFEEKN